MIVLNVIMHLSCLYSIIFRWNPRHQLVEWSYLFTSLFWFFTLAPFYRYTSVLSFLMFLHLPSLAHRIFSVFGFLKFSLKTANKIQVSLLFLMLLYISIPFMMRHYYTFKQWPERNEYRVYHWLDQSMQHHTEKKNLIIDEAIGFYYSMHHPDKYEFTLPYALHKYDIRNYERVYYLTFRKSPTLSNLVSTYNVPEAEELPSLGKKILTYECLKLYEVHTQEALDELRRK